MQSGKKVQHEQIPTSETRREAMSESMIVAPPRALAFVSKHPWMSVSAAAAAGALIGAALGRIPEDLGDRARSSAGTWASALGAVALRYGVTIGARKLVDGLQHRFSTERETTMEKKTENGSGFRAATSERLETVKSRTGGAVNAATSGVGRGLEGAARGVQRATDRVSSAGQYLQDATPGQMGADLTELIRRHPKKSIAIGVGLGFLISRMISR